jgi:hypothetical protein
LTPVPGAAPRATHAQGTTPTPTLTVAPIPTAFPTPPLPPSYGPTPPYCGSGSSYYPYYGSPYGYPTASGSTCFALLAGTNSATTLWTGNYNQTGYLLLRTSASGSTILPRGGLILPTQAITYTDSPLGADPLYCYMALPVGGSPVQLMGNSDLLCTFPNSRSGTAPRNVTIGGTENGLVNFTWTPPTGSYDGYALVELGSSPRVVPIAPPLGLTTTSASVVARSGPTCYTLVATFQGQIAGHSDLVCAAPWLSMLGAASANTGAATSTPRR